MFSISISQTKKFSKIFGRTLISHVSSNVRNCYTHFRTRHTNSRSRISVHPISQIAILLMIPRLIEFPWNISKYRKKGQKIVKMSLNILLYSAGNTQNIIREMKNLFLFIQYKLFSTGIVSYSAVFQISLKSFGRSWCTLGFHVSEDFSEIF